MLRPRDPHADFVILISAKNFQRSTIGYLNSSCVLVLYVNLLTTQSGKA